MKHLTFLLSFMSILHCTAQHVYKASMDLIIIDSNGSIISQNRFKKNNYQVFVQKGDGSLYAETNIDSLGIIHISRNDVMPENVGMPWSIILIYDKDTMFVQYQSLHVSSNFPVELNISNGSFIYDLIRTSNTNLELGWKLIEIEKIAVENAQPEWSNNQMTLKNDCIRKISEGEFRKSNNTLTTLK